MSISRLYIDIEHLISLMCIWVLYFNIELVSRYRTFDINCVIIIGSVYRYLMFDIRYINTSWYVTIYMLCWYIILNIIYVNMGSSCQYSDVIFYRIFDIWYGNMRMVCQYSNGMLT